MPMAYSLTACEEVKDTAEENFSIEGGIQCSVQLKVAGTDRLALVNDLLLNQNPWPPFAAYTKPPRAYQANAVPFSTTQAVDGQAYVWDDYVVTVKYSTDPTRTLVSEAIEPMAEFLRLDHRAFRWTSGAPLIEAESPGVLMPSFNLVRTFFQKASVPPQVLTGANKVHNASYASPFLGLTFAAETLLYVPSPITQTITTAGSEGFNYTIRFAYKPNGWNKYYRPQTNAWEAIHNLAGAAIKPYAPMDLSALLAAS